MRIKNIKLLNFRNYDDVTIDFIPGVNIIIGDNGVGKTNILEAIYVLSLTKSNRFGNDFDLIKTGKSNLNIIGEVEYDDYLKRYQVSIDKNSKNMYNPIIPFKL